MAKMIASEQTGKRTLEVARAINDLTREVSSGPRPSLGGNREEKHGRASRLGEYGARR